MTTEGGSVEGGITEGRTSYDVVVVGAGTAGCVMAARLSERPGRSVLLLDAGPDLLEHPPEAVSDASTLPAATAPWVRRVDVDLGPGHRGRLVAGELVGGSAAVNGAYFIRATPSDLESLALAGGERWSADATTATFIRMESDQEFGAEPYHGSSGPVPVTRSPHDVVHPATDALYAAAARSGHPADPDKNRSGTVGFGPVPRNVSGAVRVSTAVSHLAAARDRPNLTVLGGAAVRRVVVQDGVVVGVDVLAGGRSTLHTAGDVVLCAGAVGSADLLLRSGIGPAADLSASGFQVVHDAAGVGSRCSNHAAIDLSYLPSRRDDTRTAFLQGALHTGGDAPVEIMATRRSYGRVTGDDPGDEVLSLRVSPLRPRVRGRVVVGPHGPSVRIHPLADPDDRADLRSAVRLGASLLAQPDFADVVETDLGPGSDLLRSDAELDDWIRANLTMSMHLCGTAPMGPSDDPFAVVDQHGSVHGLRGLRVVDASVIPRVPGRGPAATVVMVAEHVARLIEAQGESA